jgi:hypothetical protein
MMIIRPRLARLVSTRVPIVRTFSFTPRFFVGDIRTFKEERNRLLALKKRLEAREVHIDEMDDHMYDPMRLCLSWEH